MANKYGKSVDYENDVKAGKIIPRKPSETSDEHLADYKAGKIIARPGMKNTNLKDLDFSQEALLTKYANGRQELISRKYFEANIDRINALRKAQGLTELTVDQAVTAAKAVYDILNDKGKKNDDRKNDVKAGKIIPRPGEKEEAVPPTPTPEVSHTVTFKADENSLVDGQAEKTVVVKGPTDPVSLTTLVFPVATIKPEKTATKKIADDHKWKVTGAITGNKTEAELKAMSINGDITVTVITAGK